jgi:DNA-binding transcriptional ArsR family regulator
MNNKKLSIRFFIVVTKEIIDILMKFVYVIRRDKDWINLNFSSFYCEKWNVKNIAEAWSNVFNMTYQTFRYHLNKIRESNVKKLKFDYYLEEFQLNELKENYIVFPTDDDDWFADDIIEIIREHIDEHKIYRWNFLEFSAGEVRNHVYPNWNLDFKYQSNNYALVNPENHRLVTCHGFADRNLDIKQEKYIPLNLSMHNRNLGSLSLLQHHRSNLNEALINWYFEYQKSIIGDIPICFQNYIDQMIDLYKKLKLKLL